MHIQFCSHAKRKTLFQIDGVSMEAFVYAKFLVRMYAVSKSNLEKIDDLSNLSRNKIYSMAFLTKTTLNKC